MRDQNLKKRVDQLLVERGLAESRHKAHALLLAGQVLIDGQKVEKPGRLVPASSDIRILREMPFASRAGGKLRGALDHFGIQVAGRVCADLGASTGGFTDCLLQNGAREVHAFDVGKGQLAWKLQADPRVIVRDGVNVRYLTGADLPPDVSLVTADLSFISLTKVLAPLREALGARGGSGRVDLVLLVKPQFEVGKGEVGKGGVVRDAAKQAAALRRVEECARATGYQLMGVVDAAIEGARGNREFLMYLRLPPDLSSPA
jgi:23S rRNA (cytidine1920-2'-O)/16S rRNA (cytidine1409-2'-O)-methyltransferase